MEEILINFLIISKMAADIYRYYKKMEVLQQVPPEYLEKQTIVTPAMRRQIVQIIYALCEEIQYEIEVYYLAIAILDHYLMRVDVGADKPYINLVFRACLAIAAKFIIEIGEDSVVSDLVHGTNYSVTALIAVEWAIFQTLNFQVGFITPYSYLDYFSEDSTMDERKIMQWVGDVSITDANLVSHYYPSMLAASVVMLVRRFFDLPVDVDRLGYTEAELGPCLTALTVLIRATLSEPRSGIAEQLDPPTFEILASSDFFASPTVGNN